ncbi:SAM-dependent methyltransferase [Actinacidiphila cocklensis]|uniref:S-adenosyl methyltransferase n=1 Tax=Actinacidiphila cocklensis TaxID=887465 RepID=A0A9W4DZW8_9ACTN|nr:SAM-dependent methyltransferase [Actinacidiphila cocklensis]WSX75252.1 SAM-dependent methyltransferase [Streptomyces sp. NBC_00899]CAG6390708.1 S-adenosyl methyltransferase [Actinacidiphila cocklensis]
MTDQGFTADEIDTSRPHPARMYNYYLGGKDNYEVDREAAQRVIDLAPELVPMARANRAFMHRAVRLLVESGVRQIIDIGTGIPTSPNTHQVAHELSPDVRVAYVDNDPIVATHAGAHLLGTGNTGFLLGDLRDPQSILNHPTIGELIDLDQPVGLMLMAILHFVQDDEDPAGLVAAYLDALPAGSHLVLTHSTTDFHRSDPNWSQARDVYRDRRATAALTLRPYEQVLGLFGDLELLEPGLVQAPLWRPDGPAPTAEELSHIGFYGGVGYKR